LIDYIRIEFHGTIQDDDFKRIYKSKKQIQNQTNLKIIQLKKSNYFYRKKNAIITSVINDFEANFQLDRRYLTYFIEKIEIDTSKKIYLYCKFKKNNY